MTENEELMRRVFAELAKGNGRPFVESLADDFTWTIIGSTSWSGTYRGRRAVLRDLLEPLMARFADGYRNTAHRFVVEDDYVVVECRGEATTTAGLPYNNAYCWVCRLAGGKLRELTEYADTELMTTALGDREAVTA
jgi:uncharacterized protein